MHGLSTLILAVLPVICAAGEGQSVVYQVNGSPYEGFWVDGGKGAPFILEVHDWDGLNNYEQTRARMLGKLGYSVFAADLFGKGIRPATIDERKKLTGELYADRAKMRQLLHAAIDEAAKRGADTTRAVAAGYCFGGAAVLELARSGKPLRGFAIFHGGLATPADQDYSKVHGKILVMHGTADQAVPVDQFFDLEKRLDAAKVPCELTLYGGAGHAFTIFGGELYNKEADDASWKRFTAFLEEMSVVKNGAATVKSGSREKPSGH